MNPSDLEGLDGPGAALDWTSGQSWNCNSYPKIFSLIDNSLQHVGTRSENKQRTQIQAEIFYMSFIFPK